MLIDLIWLFENRDRDTDQMPNKFTDKHNLHNLNFERKIWVHIYGGCWWMLSDMCSYLTFECLG